MRLRLSCPLSRALALVEPLARSEIQCPSGTLPPETFVSLDTAGECGSGSLTFIQKPSPASLYRTIQPGLALSEVFLEGVSFPFQQVSSVRRCMHLLIEGLGSLFEYDNFGDNSGEVHRSAVVEGTVAGGALVGAGCYLGPGSHIGTGTVMQPGSSIMEHCIVGSDCLIQPGVVIGSGGFGFYGFQGQVFTMPHPAGVRIGDKVWIGANSVIASGVLHPTVIGDRCKLDSHLQIAHNVHLGPDSMIASQSGIAGSTRIGSGFRMGGASSIAGHLTIGDNVTVAARSGVTKNIRDNAVIAGYPARPLADWKRQMIHLKESAQNKGRTS